jgi:hypothetical protein
MSINWTCEHSAVGVTIGLPFPDWPMAVTNSFVTVIERLAPEHESRYRPAMLAITQ